MKKIIAVLAFFFSTSSWAATQPLKVNVSGTDFILPFQKVSATQLYSLRDKKGYPAAETVIVGRLPDQNSDYKEQITFGAAPVLGSSQNVPFLAAQVRLSRRFFDTSNNSLLFGVWIGKESDKKNATWGIKASVPLW